MRWLKIGITLRNFEWDYVEFALKYYAQQFKQEGKSCIWKMAFDGHYNLSCAGETHERGNFEFNKQWRVKHCTYCGGKITFIGNPIIVCE